jgi:NADH-quinone oxidoreductase subunit C
MPMSEETKTPPSDSGHGEPTKPAPPQPAPPATPEGAAKEAVPPAEKKPAPASAEAPAKPAPAAKPPAAKAPAGPAYADISGDPLAQKLKAQFGDALEDAVELLGQQIIRVARNRAHDVLRFLRDDSEAQFDFLTDLTAVHYPDKPQPFEMVYLLYSFPRHARLRVKVALADGETIESVTDLWGTANWMERECYDMFGIRFEHHPDLRRILLPPDWDSFPLRKEHQLEYQENDWVRRHLVIREVHPETDLTGKYEMTEFVKANR